MYANYFGLRELPFNNTPDPRFFFSTPDHDEALASLVYTVQERKGFVLLTGEVGAGKTLVSRMMLRRFGMQVAFATIHHSLHNASDLMQTVCTEFELPFEPRSSNAQLVRLLHDYLLAQFSQDTPVVLVLDEAQALPDEAFEQLRMIGNLEADDAKLLQTVIVGQPELQRRFGTPKLRQLRQRIFRSFHLPALDRKHTEGYIRHRLGVAGCKEQEVFQGAAIDRIHRFSQGLPRLINTACDNAMLSAYSANLRIISAEFVDSVIAQMMMIHPAMQATCEAVSPWAATQGGPADWSTLEDEGLFVSDQPKGRWPEGAMAGEGSPPPGLIESLVRRVSALESQIRFADATRGMNQPTDTETGTRKAAPDAERRLALRVSEADRRAQELDRHLAKAPAIIAQTRAVQAGLQPIVQQAQGLVARVDGALQQLGEREARVTRQAATISSALAHLRSIHTRLSDLQEKSCRVERRAQTVYDRLNAQVQRSQELLQGLSASSSTFPTSPEQKLAFTAPREASPNERVESGSRVAQRRTMRTALGEAQRQIDDLRALAARARREACDCDAEAASPPTGQGPSALATDRLVLQVDDLLSLVGEGTRDRGANVMGAGTAI